MEKLVGPWRRLFHGWITYLFTPIVIKLVLVLHLEDPRNILLQGQLIHRVKDGLFTDTVVGGREITCSGRPPEAENLVFPSETWSCYNISVNGRRLQYWHMDGLCSLDKNGSVVNDYGALCKAIMEAHRVHEQLWAAMVSQVSCKHSRKERVVYDVSAEGGYTWRDHHMGRGYVLTLQCMMDPDSKPKR